MCPKIKQYLESLNCKLTLKLQTGMNEGQRGKEGGLAEEGGTGGKGGWGGKGFGVRKQDLHPAGAVTAPVVWCCEDLWLFSYQH